MADRDRSKKTDKIEVRLSPETKQAFHETCEQQGESASGVIRRLIEEYVARFHQPVIARPIDAIRRTPWWVRAGGLAALVAGAVGLAALPGQADAVPSWKISFKAQDTNGDGHLTESEILGPFLPKALDTMEAGAAERLHKRLTNMVHDQFLEQDADGNGEVTLEEFRLQYIADATRRFRKLDADQDGAIALKEFSAPGDYLARAYVSGMAAGLAFGQGATVDEFDSEADRRWTSGKTDEASNAMAIRIGQVFQSIDADVSGTISLHEFLAR